jgi:hypothetical protein
MRKNRNKYGILVMKYPDIREFFEDIYILEDNIKTNFSTVSGEVQGSIKNREFII